MQLTLQAYFKVRFLRFFHSKFLTFVSELLLLQAKVNRKIKYQSQSWGIQKAFPVYE